MRASLGGRVVLDTTRTVYLWEWPYYPQYYVPLDDIDPNVLIDENHEIKVEPRNSTPIRGARR